MNGWTRSWSGLVMFALSSSVSYTGRWLYWWYSQCYEVYGIHLFGLSFWNGGGGVNDSKYSKNEVHYFSSKSKQ